MTSQKSNKFGGAIITTSDVPRRGIAHVIRFQSLYILSLVGVIYTLGVNDRGSHLCLGVIYASDTGTKQCVNRISSPVQATDRNQICIISKEQVDITSVWPRRFLRPVISYDVIDFC